MARETRETTIVKVNGTLDEKGLRFTESPFPVKATENSFLRAKTPDYPAARIGKHKLLSVGTTMYIKPDHVYFFTWCFPEDVDKAKTLILQCVRREVETMKKQIETLFSGLYQTKKFLVVSHFLATGLINVSTAHAPADDMFPDALYVEEVPGNATDETIAKRGMELHREWTLKDLDS